MNPQPTILFAESKLQVRKDLPVWRGWKKNVHIGSEYDLHNEGVWRCMMCCHARSRATEDLVAIFDDELHSIVLRMHVAHFAL